MIDTVKDSKRYECRFRKVKGLDKFSLFIFAYLIFYPTITTLSLLDCKLQTNLLTFSNIIIMGHRINSLLHCFQPTPQYPFMLRSLSKYPRKFRNVSSTKYTFNNCLQKDIRDKKRIGINNSFTMYSCKDRDTFGKNMTDPKTTGKHSLILKIYIEHVDRYNVMYHSNYLKFMSRAIQSIRGPHEIIEIQDFKFLIPAKLGDEILLETNEVYDKKIETVDESEDIKMISKDSSNIVKCDDIQKYEITLKSVVDPSVIYCSATVMATSPFLDIDRVEYVDFDDGRLNTSKMNHKMESRTKNRVYKKIKPIDNPLYRQVNPLWEDEFKRNGGLFPHTFLSTFERIRTQAIGGPSELEKYMVKDNIMFVVAKIDNYHYNAILASKLDQTIHEYSNEEIEEINKGKKNDDEKNNISQTSDYLNMIETVSNFKMRGSSLCICHQQLWQRLNPMKISSDDFDKENEVKEEDGTSDLDVLPEVNVIGEAVVTLACLNAKTGKITKFPEKFVNDLNM